MDDTRNQGLIDKGWHTYTFTDTVAACPGPVWV